MSNIISNRMGHRPMGYVTSQFFGMNTDGSYMRELRKIDREAREASSRGSAVIHVRKGESRLGAYLSSIPEKSKRKRG